MEDGFVERRRFPRVPIEGGAAAVRPLSMAVRLLDLSSGGVLLSCPEPLPPGVSSRVIARLGSRSLDAELDVRHVSREWDSRVGGYRIGGRFAALGQHAKLAVESLLRGGEPRD